ncbi:MAG TPA: DUF6612 family protein [Anaerolineae bacterium]|nr:DUF6612 family protein [Anaerolineae bacterium]
MKHARTLIVALLLFALVAILAACGGEPAPADTAVAPEATTAPAATNTAVPPTDAPDPTAETAVEEPTAASQEGTGLNLDELSAPSDLSSYRATMTMRISGTEAGETVDGTLEFLMEYTSEPQAQHIQMSGSGMEEVESTGVIDMYQLEDNTYVQFGDQWLSVPTTEEMTANMGLIEPDDLLDDTCGWEQQGDTDYEGIQTQHWTLSTEDAADCMTAEMMGGVGNISEASGDLYVAEEGNYIVHMEVVLTGTEIAAAMGTEDQVLDDGTMEITFDMRDVNQPFTIEIPEEALASGTLPEDLPIPEDAEELSNAFGMISYNTAQTPAEINDYYKAEMPANGWTEVSAEELSGMFMLEYSKDGRTANLTINTDDDSGNTSVLIIIEEPES